MNEVFQKLWLIALMVTLLSPTGSTPSVIINGIDHHDSQVVVLTELTNVTQADIERVRNEVRIALNTIPQILAVEYKNNAIIKIVDSNICYTTNNTISLSISHIKDKSAPVIHEVTHILAQHQDNSFFSEGLAVYFQARFGATESFPNFSTPLDDLVRDAGHQLMSIPSLTKDNRIFEQVGTEKRRLAYIEAGSFINFLTVKYGAQKLSELHNSRSLNYQKIFGKKLEELAAEWKNYVFRIPPKKI